MVISLIIGFTLMDSPAVTRAKSYDLTRENDLRNISAGVDNYFNQSGQLPINLEDLKPIINHLVYFNSEGSMVGERTSYVENHTSSRRLYVDFLKQMEKKRVHLTNDFEQLWRSEPTRYPMGDDFKY